MGNALSGKVAFVTGAAAKRGMGRAVAVRLAREGADVVVNDKFSAPKSAWAGRKPRLMSCASRCGKTATTRPGKSLSPKFGRGCEVSVHRPDRSEFNGLLPASQFLCAPVLSLAVFAPLR